MLAKYISTISLLALIMRYCKVGYLCRPRRANAPTIPHQKDGETFKAFQDRQLVMLKRDLAGMAFLERQYQKCRAAADWYLNRSSQPAA